MASSQVCETLAFLNNDEGMMRGMEVLEIKGDLLMSLMEESPSDERDYDEKLDSLIRSFEAEISGSTMGGHDSTYTGSQLKSNFEEDIESWNIGQVEGEDYWASSPSSDGFGVQWVDMDLIPFDEKDVMVDHLMVCDGFDMEEHVYNSFWQDNYEMQLVD